MAKDKVFVGQGIKFGQYDQLSFSICMEDVKPFMKKSATNGKHYVNLVIAKMKEKNKNGKTHTVYVDQWEKHTEEAKAASAESQKELEDMYGKPAPVGPAFPGEISTDDIPF
jgi:hypothetical protein